MPGMELVTMSAREMDRLEVVRRVLERRLTRAKAGELMGLSERQVQRLCKAVEVHGPGGLASKKRGRPSNRRLPDEIRERAIAIVRERYADFGPKLAHEKLLELHDIRVGRETLRKWLAGAGIWTTRRERLKQPHQPRHRRDCLGELVQIDGCDHEWFEDRGPRCTLLVYVDDATGRLMELRFVVSESAFDYFRATISYLKRHGKPVALYSDKHSIFRVNAEGATGRSKGVTQFGRALNELNIDIICANTPQAKGRVERMNQTLQDRLVKELRLRDIANMDAGNAFLPAFMDDYNRRFAKPPRNPHDAHRPLRGNEDLDRIFTWQEERTLTHNLTVHFKRMTYLIERTPENMALARKRVDVHEAEDGSVEIHFGGRQLPYSVFENNPIVSQGAVVENKRLGAVLSVIQGVQTERDRVRLSGKNLTKREKARIAEARSFAGVPPVPPAAPFAADHMVAYLNAKKAEQSARWKVTRAMAAIRRQGRALGARAD
jgi:hypothetical protein